MYFYYLNMWATRNRFKPVQTKTKPIKTETIGFGCGFRNLGTKPLVVVVVFQIWAKTRPNRTAAALQCAVDGWKSLDPDSAFYAEFDTELGRRCALLSLWDGQPTSLDTGRVVSYMLTDCGVEVSKDVLISVHLYLYLEHDFSTISHILPTNCQRRSVMWWPKSQLDA